jgi:hypothetical protein
MSKNSLFNIVKSDVKVSKEYVRKNTIMQTQSFYQYIFWKPIICMLSKESIAIMFNDNSNKSK